MMSITGLFGQKAEKKAAHEAYTVAVAQGRLPLFYAEHHVPDTLDGRFEMIALHVFLILRRVKNDRQSGAFAQALFDIFFADMDRGLRELGTGDLSVGKQIKLMATGFYGRIAAYDAGLDRTADLEAALRRNLYGTVADIGADDLEAAAAYLRLQAAFLDSQSCDDIRQGRIRFAPVATAEGAP
jgi:cytochrome b pre-mRNA-processing protein 3